MLLTDVIMPGLNGREVHKLMNELQPDLSAPYMSGYSQDIIAHHGVLAEDINLIHKPLTVKSLVAKVREVLDR